MRRTLALLLVIIILLGAGIPASGRALQAATPMADQSSPADRANPRMGDIISYIGPSGAEVATLRVTDMVQPWDEYGEFYEPNSGTEYVAFIIEVTHLGSRGDLIVRADDFRLQDIDGFFYARSWSEPAASAEVVPSESEVPIASGETREIVVIYQVISGIELTHLFWQPAYDRLVTLANLDG